MTKVIAPKPITISPIRISIQFSIKVAYHVIIDPIMTKTEFTKYNLFYPYLSAKIPPRKGQNKLGIEYAV